MDNFLFKNLKKLHIIYLLITIIIILLLFKISVEGFIPYYIKTNDINNYCATNSSGQYYAPTMISNFKCGNQSQPETIPLSRTINFTNLQLKNNLCPLNTTYISPGSFGAVGSPYCMLNTVIAAPSNLGLQCWYAGAYSPFMIPEITFNPSGVDHKKRNRFYNKVIRPDLDVNQRGIIQDSTDMYHNLLSTVTSSTLNRDYLPTMPPASNRQIYVVENGRGEYISDVSHFKYRRLFNYGSFSFLNTPTLSLPPVAQLFTTNTMTIFIVYKVISTTSPIDNTSTINTSVLTANNKPFDINTNIRSINNTPVTSSIMLGRDDLTLTLYTASVKTISGTVYWNEKIYNENGVKSDNLTISGINTWDTSGNILSIGGNTTNTTGFYGDIGEILVYNRYLDPLSRDYIQNVLFLLQRFEINPLGINPQNMNFYD